MNHPDGNISFFNDACNGVAPALEKLLVPETGLIPMGTVDMNGLKTVLEIRSQYAPQGKTLTDVDKYLDLSFYREAISTR